MATFKVTFFFQSLRFVSAGWTESWYLDNQASIGAAIAFVNGSPYPGARLGVLSSDYEMIYYRVTTVNPFTRGASRVAYLTSSSAVGQMNNPSDLEDPSEQPYDALLIRLDLAVGRRRSFLLRGLPTGIITRVTGYAATPNWNTPFSTYLGQIVGANVPWLIQTSTLQPERFWNIVTADPTNPRALQINMAAGTVIPAEYVPGAVFKILPGAPGAPITGTYRVRSVGLSTITTYPTRRNFSQMVGVTGPVTQVINYSYSPGVAGEAIRGVKRSTGRPFDLLVGRRRVRRT